MDQSISVVMVCILFLCLSKVVFNFLEAYSGDPDKTPHSMAADLSLHCLPLTHKRTLGLNGRNKF